MAWALLATLVISCSELRESEPGRTATEQLMFSTAIERVFDNLAIQIASETKVFVDARYVQGTDSLYLVATLRDRILRQGGNLVTTRGEADLVFEPRVGALSIDRRTTLVGIPSFPIPIPLTGEFQFPELALYKEDRQQGVVKLALTSYDARTGELRSSLAPAYGFSQSTDWVVLLLIDWHDNDLMPSPQNDKWVGESTLEDTIADFEVGP